MKVVTNIAKMHELSRQARGGGLVVALVPTMGYLHRGHTSLMHIARKQCDWLELPPKCGPTRFRFSVWPLWFVMPMLRAIRLERNYGHH